MGLIPQATSAGQPAVKSTLILTPMIPNDLLGASTNTGFLLRSAFATALGVRVELVFIASTLVQSGVLVTYTPDDPFNSIGATEDPGALLAAFQQQQQQQQSSYTSLLRHRGRGLQGLASSSSSSADATAATAAVGSTAVLKLEAGPKTLPLSALPATGVAVTVNIALASRAEAAAALVTLGGVDAKTLASPATKDVAVRLGVPFPGNYSAFFPPGLTVTTTLTLTLKWWNPMNPTPTVSATTNTTLLSAGGGANSAASSSTASLIPVIIGSSVGGLLLCLGLIILVILVRRRRAKAQKVAPGEEEEGGEKAKKGKAAAKNALEKSRVDGEYGDGEDGEEGDGEEEERGLGSSRPAGRGSTLTRREAFTEPALRRQGQQQPWRTTADDPSGVKSVEHTHEEEDEEGEGEGEEEGGEEEYSVLASPPPRYPLTSRLSAASRPPLPRASSRVFSSLKKGGGSARRPSPMRDDRDDEEDTTSTPLSPTPPVPPSQAGMRAAAAGLNLQPGRRSRSTGERPGEGMGKRREQFQRAAAASMASHAPMQAEQDEEERAGFIKDQAISTLQRSKAKVGAVKGEGVEGSSVPGSKRIYGGGRLGAKPR